MSTSEPSCEPAENGHKFGVEFSRLFGPWLADENITLVLPTSRPDGLLFVGRRSDGAPSIQWTPLPKVQTVAAGMDGTIWAGQSNELWKFENVTRTSKFRLEGGELYVPRLRIFTGALDVADLAVDGFGKCLLASRAYSVIGRASYEASMEPVWRPAFVTKVAKETRCGLSGLGLYDGPRHCASVWSTKDHPDGWRENYLTGGAIVGLQSGRILADGLCLPIAPRWSPSGLYWLNAGTAEFGRLAAEGSGFESICACPAYPTGLFLHGHWAVIAVSSKPPTSASDLALPAQVRFRQQKVELYSGILVVDLRTGDIAHNARWVDTEALVNGVAVIPQCLHAAALVPEDTRLDALVSFRVSQR